MENTVLMRYFTLLGFLVSFAGIPAQAATTLDYTIDPASISCYETAEGSVGENGTSHCFAWSNGELDGNY